MIDNQLLLIIVVFIAFICEYADATIGMGYGTTLTPILLLMGFEPLAVVQSVLIGQIAGGAIGGFFHYKLGNVNLEYRSNDSKVIILLSGFGTIGAIIAVFCAIKLPSNVLTIYVGIMVLVIGIIILIKRNHQMKLNWYGLSIIAIISAFNKGISGGGYGPLITGGQLVSGRKVKNAVGSTTIAELFVCIVAFVLYIIFNRELILGLVLATSIGSVVAAPFAAYTVKKVKAKNLKLLIGIVIIILGILTLINVF